MGILGTLAVTGGIGSGKSLVCRFLEERGFPVYDSDSRTKALYDNDSKLVQDIRDRMAAYRDGKGPLPENFLLGNDGRIDRGWLSSIVFSGPRSSEALAELESVVHPAVLRDFELWKSSREVVAAARFGTVVMESAIILDKPLFLQAMDKVLLVDAPVEIRLRRASERDGVPSDHIVGRMSHQQGIFGDISHGKAHPDIDFVIENTGTPEELRRKVDEFIVLNYSNGK